MGGKKNKSKIHVKIALNSFFFAAFYFFLPNKRSFRNFAEVKKRQIKYPGNFQMFRFATLRHTCHKMCHGTYQYDKKAPKTNTALC